MESRKFVYPSGVFLDGAFELQSLNDEVFKASSGELSLLGNGQKAAGSKSSLIEADVGLIFASGRGASSRSMFDFMLMKALDIPVVVLESFARAPSSKVGIVGRAVGCPWDSWPRTEIQREYVIELYNEATTAAEKEQDVRLKIVKNVAVRLTRALKKACSAPSIFPTDPDAIKGLCLHFAKTFNDYEISAEQVARFIAKKVECP